MRNPYTNNLTPAERQVLRVTVRIEGNEAALLRFIKKRGVVYADYRILTTSVRDNEVWKLCIIDGIPCAKDCLDKDDRMGRIVNTAAYENLLQAVLAGE